MEYLNFYYYCVNILKIVVTLSAAALRPAGKSLAVSHREAGRLSLPCNLPHTPLPPPKSKRNQDKDERTKGSERGRVWSPWTHFLTQGQRSQEQVQPSLPLCVEPLAPSVRHGQGAPVADRVGQVWRPGGHLPRPWDEPTAFTLRYWEFLTDNPVFPPHCQRDRMKGWGLVLEP